MLQGGAVQGAGGAQQSRREAAVQLQGGCEGLRGRLEGGQRQVKLRAVHQSMQPPGGDRQGSLICLQNDNS